MRRSGSAAVIRLSGAHLRLATLAALGSSTLAPMATAAGFHDADVRIVSISGVSKQGMTTGDLDGDGLPDLVVSVTANPAAVLVMDKDGGEWKTRQVLSAPLGASSARPLVVEDGLLVLWSSGEVERYTGWPLQFQEGFDVEVDWLVGQAFVADIDGDGDQSLVFSDWSMVRSYDLDTQSLEWERSGGGGVTAYQFDADAALELAMSSGLVIDGATLAEEWSYVDGFGALLAGGRVGAQGAAGLVAGEEWSHFTVFQSQPWSPVWDWDLFQMSSLHLADLDGDGIDEILQGDGQWGELHVIDSQTRQERFNVPHSGHYVSSIATADFDGNGTTQIVFSPSTAYDGVAATIVGPDGAGAETLLQASEAGGFHAVAHGDIDADGSLEYVFASDSDPASVRVLDFASHTTEWESPTDSWNANDWNYTAFRNVHVAQLDADPALEIVLAGTSLYDGRIVVLDGASKAVQRQIGYYSDGPMQARTVTGSELVDVTGDGVPELVVATHAVTTGASGVKLFLFSLTSGEMLWESVAMGTGFAKSRGVVTGQFDADPAPELVAVLPTGFRIYDGVSRLLEDTIEASVSFAVFDDRNGRALRWIDPQGKLVSMDVTNGTIETPQDLPAGAVSLMLLEGTDESLLVSAGGQLVLTDLQGAPVSTSERLGSSVADYGQVSAIPQRTGWVLATGTSNGYAFIGLHGPDYIHVDGFE